MITSDPTKSSSGMSIYYAPSTYLAIEQKKTMINPTQYRIDNASVSSGQTYSLEFPVSNFNPSFKAYLYDSVFGSYTPITTTTALAGSEQIGLTYSFLWNGVSDELRFKLVITAPPVFYGKVDSYNTSTGLLLTTCVATTATQSFTYSNWQINLSGAPGIIGNTSVSLFTPSDGGTVSVVSNSYNIINTSPISDINLSLPSGNMSGESLEIKFTNSVTTIVCTGASISNINSATAGQYFKYVWYNSTWY